MGSGDWGEWRVVDPWVGCGEDSMLSRGLFTILYEKVFIVLFKLLLRNDYCLETRMKSVEFLCLERMKELNGKIMLTNLGHQN